MDVREIKWDETKGFIWLRVGSSVGLVRTFGLHKMLGSS
jgi:hypothetical protein